MPGHPYRFRGLITCGVCERKMVGNPNHSRLYYRYTASRDFVRQHHISHPPALYVREDTITEPIDRFLRAELTGSTLTDNLRRAADAQYRAALAAPDTTGEIDELRQTRPTATWPDAWKQERPVQVGGPGSRTPTMLSPRPGPTAQAQFTSLLRPDVPGSIRMA
ncbi:zinc ribbon domain-containing protein [Krasilnikovia sp. MM14-A1259]|uniref:zinc ribbon domain-containing protein n=1 Tax=Krasilnikovia sp. MM14-A1259 TaxID=3373539 RepID=UPI00382E8184